MGGNRERPVLLKTHKWKSMDSLTEQLLRQEVIKYVNLLFEIKNICERWELGRENDDEAIEKICKILNIDYGNTSTK